MSTTANPPEDMDWVELGLYLGYPVCCVIDFSGRMHLAYTEHYDLLDRKARPLSGSGYVPCPLCAQKTEEELIATIVANRKCPTPFPEYTSQE